MESKTLEVKGAGVISIIEYVKAVHGPSGYAQWLDALSSEARRLVEGTVFASSWYGGDAAVFELREKVCDVFFNGDPQAARAVGRFAAEQGLRGIYKALVKVGSVDWVMSRASMVGTRYIRPIVVTPLVLEKRRILVRLEGIGTKSEPLEASLCGFIGGAAEISGARDVSVHCPIAVSKGDPFIHFDCVWKD